MVLLLASLSTLILATLLLSSCSTLLAGTLCLTIVANHDPTVHSLLSHLSPGAAAIVAAGPLHPPPYRRNRFLQLTYLNTFDDDFFSNSDTTTANDRHFPHWPTSSNTSFPVPIRLYLIDGALGSPSSPKSIKIKVPKFPSSPFHFSFPVTTDIAAPLLLRCMP